MDEDKLNVTLRKFLKEVGVTSQREVERAVRDALGGGRLHGSETLRATMTLRVGGIDLVHEVEGALELGGTPAP